MEIIRKTGIMLLSVLLTGTAALSQEIYPAAIPQGPLDVFVAENILVGDTLRLDFTVRLRKDAIGRGEALHVVPVYRAGEMEWRLPKILFNGKKRSAYYRREQVLASHNDYWEMRPYKEVRVFGKDTLAQVRYLFSDVTPKELRSPEDGRLALELFVEDCCDWRFTGNEPVALTVRPDAGKTVIEEAPEVTAPVALPPLVVDEGGVVFLRPAREERKERKENLSLHINFIVDRHDILPAFADNASELLKADSLLRPLSSMRETYTINSAAIRGYASPEATWQHNLALSQRRADSFRKYITDRYPLSELSSFPAVGMGEDWDGLRSAVAANTTMPDRDKVLAIIDFTDIFHGREKQLMDLSGGKTYRWMLENLFPPLRRMEMEVSYTVRPFGEAELGAEYDRNPKNLSQEEIYLLARSRNAGGVTEEGRGNYGLEYDMAAALFPEDKIALLNASSAAIIRGDYSRARRYLEELQDMPEAANNIGLCLLESGDFDKAGEYLKKALTVDATAAAARNNLKLCHSRRLQAAGETGSL